MADEVTSPEQSFQLIAERITEETAKKLNCIYQFKIQDAGDWSVDLTKASGWVSKGVNEAAKCTITVGGKEWVDILNGKLNPDRPPLATVDIDAPLQNHEKRALWKDAVALAEEEIADEERKALARNGAGAKGSGFSGETG